MPTIIEGVHLTRMDLMKTKNRIDGPAHRSARQPATRSTIPAIQGTSESGSISLE